jgi:nucleoside-diphosphate-sugar epimerase
VRAVKADLGDAAAAAALFENEEVGAVIALHGIMSGGSEADFELGWAVNVDSHVTLLKAARAHSDKVWKPRGTKMVYVFISSLAVYGGPKCKPTDHVVPA